MNKYACSWMTIFLLLMSCSTNSNLVPPEPVHKADNGDLERMTECRSIQAGLRESEAVLSRYKKSKSLNTLANVFSGIASVLSFGTGSADYVSNQDLDNGIRSYEERIKVLKKLEEQYCVP